MNMRPSVVIPVIFHRGRPVSIVSPRSRVLVPRPAPANTCLRSSALSAACTVIPACRAESGTMAFAAPFYGMCARQCAKAHIACKVPSCSMFCFVMQIDIHRSTRADDVHQFQLAPYLMNMSNSSRILSSFGAARLSGASRGVLITPCKEIASATFRIRAHHAIL